MTENENAFKTFEMYTQAKEATTIALGFPFKTAQVTQVAIVQVRLLKTRLFKLTNVKNYNCSNS
jgi:hypothetical protein